MSVTFQCVAFKYYFWMLAVVKRMENTEKGGKPRNPQQTKIDMIHNKYLADAEG